MQGHGAPPLRPRGLRHRRRRSGGAAAAAGPHPTWRTAPAQPKLRKEVAVKKVEGKRRECWTWDLYTNRSDSSDVATLLPPAVVYWLADVGPVRKWDYREGSFCDNGPDGAERGTGFLFAATIPQKTLPQITFFFTTFGPFLAQTGTFSEVY